MFYKADIGIILKVWILLLVLMSGCISPNRKRNLKYVKSLSYLSDSTFLSDVRNIDFYNNRYMVSENRRGQIIELDEQLNVVSNSGTLGEGPGELKGLTRFFIRNDSIFAINPGERTIEVYLSGDTLSRKTIPIPEEIVGTRVDFRFFVTNTEVFVSAPESGSAITSFNMNGIISRNIGRLEEFKVASDNPKFANSIRNLQFIFQSSDGKIISVMEGNPVIRVFDPSGNIINTFYANEYGTIRERKSYIDNQPKEQYSTYAYFRDVYYCDGKLYLLCISGTEKPLKANSILVFKLASDKMEFIEELQLPGKWYSSFCVSRNGILAFETTEDELQLFEL
ncbi:MAG TPA: 6-bladed beta-propeller [Cyclobacteriaceae bacterium]|nr:6-bladed beta-propeller [Cyclobacteriaceae bacterium]